MHSRCNGPIRLGAVILSVALATMEASVSVKAHLGPKMCDHFCNHIVGCDLLCHLIPATLPKPNQEKGIYLISAKDNEGMHAENTVNSNHGEQIYRIRGHTIRCIRTPSNHPTLSGKEDATEGRMTRILMVLMYQVRAVKPRQLYLDNTSAVTYHFLQVRQVLAFAFIPSIRTFVVSTSSSRKLLFFTPIDDEKQTIVKRNKYVRAICIDDHKQLVFLKVVHPKHVCVMSTRGKHISIFSLERSCDIKRAGGFVADQKRSLIYALCFRNKILKYTYQGVPRGNVLENANLRVLYLHMQYDRLYYHTTGPNGALHKLSLSKHSVTKLTLQVPHIRSMLIVGSLLYIIPTDFKGDLLVVNMSGISTVTKISTGFKMNVRSNVDMCLIH